MGGGERSHFAVPIPGTSLTLFDFCPTVDINGAAADIATCRYAVIFGSDPLSGVAYRLAAKIGQDRPYQKPRTPKAVLKHRRFRDEVTLIGFLLPPSGSNRLARRRLDLAPGR